MRTRPTDVPSRLRSLMTTVLSSATIRLTAGVTEPRRADWRCACRIEGAVGSDGVALLGVEVTPTAGGDIGPAEEVPVELRLWAPLAQQPTARATIRFYEGSRLVASGTVTGVIASASSPVID